MSAPSFTASSHLILISLSESVHPSPFPFLTNTSVQSTLPSFNLHTALGSVHAGDEDISGPGGDLALGADASRERLLDGDAEGAEGGVARCGFGFSDVSKNGN